jgi:chorismate-pyruvate lyase
MPTAGPDLDTMLALFPPASYLRAEPVAADQVPEPYHRLLVHEHHMTVTVEAHHGDLVNVVVLERRHQGDTYSRKILLALQQTGQVVQFGLVRIRLEYCSAAVRAAILAQKTPLGRILIQHDVLRRIEPTAFLRITPGPEMLRWFKLTTPHATYGRLALIYCDGKPAIELLEIVAPESVAGASG